MNKFMFTIMRSAIMISVTRIQTNSTDSRIVNPRSILMKRSVIALFFLLCVCSVQARRKPSEPPVVPDQDMDVVLKADDTGREFEGWGALSAGATSVFLRDYPEPYRSDILDYLFKPKYGLGIQHLKVEIGSGMDSTCGSEPSHVITPEELKNPVPRGYEFWLAAEARKRNPKIMLGALPWGTPYWTKNYTTKEAAEWVISFLDVAKKHYGLDFQYVGGARNELLYLSARSAHTLPFIFVKKYLRPALDKAGYTDVQIQMADYYPKRHKGKFKWDVIKKVMADPELMKIVPVIGYHYPCGYLEGFGDNRPLPEGFLETNIRFWASEDYSVRGGKFSSGHNYMQKIIREYDELRMTKSIAWAPFTSIPKGYLWHDVGFLDASNCWNGHYKPFPAMWCMAHLTQFVEPGWKYLDSSMKGREDPCLCMTLKSPNNKDWSMIAVTPNGKVNTSVAIDKNLNSKEVHVWKSNKEQQFIKVDTIIPENNVLKITLQPSCIYTLTTTTGQQKGKPAQDPPKEVPGGPWKDDLKNYKVHDKVKYWGDYEGTFEIAEFEGQNVMKQMVPQRGCAWHKGAHGGCFAIYGGCDELQCFKLKAEARIVDGYVELGGRRIQNAVIGIRLSKNGEWTLAERDQNKKGKIEDFDPDKWHTIEFSIDQTNVTCTIDGKQVCQIPVPGSCQSPMTIALTSSYHHNMFRNIEVVPAYPSTVNDQKDKPEGKDPLEP